MQSLFFAGILSVCLAVSAGLVCCQDYPNKPLRMVAPEAGGGNDFVARLIAQSLSASLGQQVIVDNRTALGAIETAAKATPDGYTLLVTGSTLWVVPFLQQVSFNPAADFSAIALAANSPSILVVHPAVAANSVKELVALAKARPGQLNYGSAGSGSSSHLAAELFKAMAGVDIVRIPYKGTGQALNDLISGQLQLMFPTVGATIPHVKSGRLRALAVASLKPSALAPGLPTVAASGLPGYESGTVTTVFAPAGTTPVLINRLNLEIVKFLNRPEVKEKFLNAGVETIGSTPAQLAATLKSEMVRWGKLIKDAGIRAD